MKMRRRLESWSSRGGRKMRTKGNCGSIRARKKDQRSKELVSEHRRVVKTTDHGLLTEQKKERSQRGLTE